VAVVDDGGHVLVHERMDGASPSSGKGALGKAFASAMRRQTTQAMSEQLNTRPDIYYGIMNMYPGEVYLVGGGQPLLVNGRVVGAAGASGLPQGEDDEAVAAGIAAWRQMRPGAGQ
jgi:glc operon protein GlcG